MGSIVKVSTHTHTVTYVTDQLIRSLRLIITWVGLDPSKLTDDWKVHEEGIKTWLRSGHLSMMILEISHPSQGLVTRCDFTIDYSYGDGDGSMWVDTDALRYAIVKLGIIPKQCDYRCIITTKPNAPSVPGWGPTTLLSTSGFTKQNLGTTIGTESIGAQGSYWRK